MGEMNNKAMYKLSYGLFVCTVKRTPSVVATVNLPEAEFNGCITNTAIQVASDPNQIALAVNKGNYTHDLLLETGQCNVSVIAQDATFDLFKHFGFQSGRDVDKFASSKEFPIQDSYKIAENGIPYITSGTNAYFSLDVKQAIDVGSHTLFICQPTAMEVLSDVASCTYEYYQTNIKGKPQAKDAVKVGENEKGQTIWRCRICGYEWVGEELPDDFICPICKHPKADFEKITN